MFRVIITTGSFLTDGTPETQRVISRHRTRQAAERALAAWRRDYPLFYVVTVAGKKQPLKVLAFRVQDDSSQDCGQ
jgi:uncharacterized membrane protein YidH (DUF202 family)